MHLDAKMDTCERPSRSSTMSTSGYGRMLGRDTVVSSDDVSDIHNMCTGMSVGETQSGGAVATSRFFSSFSSPSSPPFSFSFYHKLA
jgi:hypothetical protein